MSIAERPDKRPDAWSVAAQGGAQTRLRILAAATALFAERGFQAATIRDLAHRADVNVAAINYHFRSKEELHAAVLKEALSEWSSEIVGAELVSPEAGLEGVLRPIIAALVAPVIEREGNRHLLRLVGWTMLQPPAERTNGSLRAFTDLVARLLRPFLPADRTPDQERLLARWLIGQCLLVSPALQADAGLTGARAADEAVESLVRLALGGIEGLRGRTRPPRD
jgi:AcrR family transcriptional regulator